jgi:hypothetical protein
MIHFTIIISSLYKSPKWSLPGFPDEIVYEFHLCLCINSMPYPCHSWFSLLSNIWWRVQIMKHLIMWSLESSGIWCHVVTLKLTDVSEVHTAAIIRAMIDSSPWWCRQYARLKRWSFSTWLHGATSQETLNFILAAMRTRNPAYLIV